MDQNLKFNLNDGSMKFSGGKLWKGASKGG